MKNRLPFALFGFLFLVAPAAFAQAPESQTVNLQLTSPSFTANGSIPGGYTCEGNDVSPPLAWTGVPEGTKSFALIVDDPDSPDPSAPKQTWVHWVIYNIPPDTNSLAAGANPLPAGTGEGLNDWGTTGYRGPCPPVGKHRYFFKFYALNAVFVPQHPLSKAQLEEAMFGHVLAQTSLIGTYELSRR